MQSDLPKSDRIARKETPIESPSSSVAVLKNAPRSGLDAVAAAPNAVGKALEYDLLTPEQVEKMKQEHMALLNSLRGLPDEELFAKVTPESISEHHKDGTLYVLMLGIDSARLDQGDGTYREMIDNVVEEAVQLRTAIAEAKLMPRAELEQRLTSPPLGEYFTQYKLPKVPIEELSTLSEEQVRTLYEVCLLEQQGREAYIPYEAGARFANTLRPSGRNRKGDCNTTAAYYASLASLSGSEKLQSVLRSVDVRGHAQLCFDLGTDEWGKRILLSKNTSYVDMSRVGSDGRWNGDFLPYVHNFYDIEQDMKDYGTTVDKAVKGPEAVVAGILSEINPRIDSYTQLSNAEMQRRLTITEKALSINPHGVCDNARYINYHFLLSDRKVISKGKTKQKASKALKNYIDTTLWSGSVLVNFTNRYGTEAAKKHIAQYEDAITSNPERFRYFMRSSVFYMRALPDYDRKLSDERNWFSKNTEAKCQMMQEVLPLLSSSKAQQMCREQIRYLNSEIGKWKPLKEE